MKMTDLTNPADITSNITKLTNVEYIGIDRLGEIYLCLEFDIGNKLQ